MSTPSSTEMRNMRDSGRRWVWFTNTNVLTVELKICCRCRSLVSLCNSDANRNFFSSSRLYGIQCESHFLNWKQCREWANVHIKEKFWFCSQFLSISVRKTSKRYTAYFIDYVLMWTAQCKIGEWLNSICSVHCAVYDQPYVFVIDIFGMPEKLWCIRKSMDEEGKGDNSWKLNSWAAFKSRLHWM